MTHFSAFRFYTPKRQRLAIFADVADRHLRFFILRCSRKDKFNKRVAKGVYQQWMEDRIYPVSRQSIIYHPQVFEVKIENPLTPKKTFIEFCIDQYLKKIRITTVLEKEILVGRNK